MPTVPMAVTLSSSDLAALGDVFRLLVSPLDQGDIDGWRKAVNDALRTLLGADSVGFLLPSPGTVPFYSDEHTPSEIGRYTHTPPPPTAGGVPMWEKVLQIRAGRLEEIFEDALPDYFASEYYNDYAAPNKACDTIGIFVPVTGPLPGVAPGMASVHLWHDVPTGRRFGSRELSMLHLLLPAFQAGVEVATAWGRHCRDLVETLDRIGQAAAIAEFRQRAVHTTTALDGLLASEPEAAALWMSLLEALDRLVRTADGERTVLTRSIRTQTNVYRLRGCLSHDPAGRPLAVVGVETVEPAVPSVDTLRERFGLTRRQAEVARLLARRLSNAEIAAALHISPHTALRHTEAVFSKLSVQDRRSAAAVLHTASE